MHIQANYFAKRKIGLGRIIPCVKALRLGAPPVRSTSKGDNHEAT